MNSSNPSPLALSAPRVPSTEANGGLNWTDLYEDPEASIAVQVVLPVGNEIRLNDRIDLCWQGDVLLSALVDDTAIQTRVVTFLVRAVSITQFGDGTHTVNYLVTTSIGGSQTRSPDRNIRVKTRVPGGTDPDAGTPYINERLVPSHDIPDIIDDSMPPLTITVPPYENMDQNDSVTLDWGGQRLTPSQDIVVDQPVTFVITRETLEASAGHVIVRYQIRDLVNNWSKWSPEKQTDVEVGNSFLLAPRVSGTGVENGEINLGLLGDSDVGVQIPAYTLKIGEARYSSVEAHSLEAQPFMEVGDLVRLIWSGRTAEGSVLPDVLVDYTVKQTDIGFSLALTIPNAQAKLIASGNATIRYSVTPVATPMKYSRRANVPVIGDVQDLPAALVLQATGSILDPDQLPEAGATIHIEKSELIAVGDFVQLLWKGTAADGTPLVQTYEIPITGGVAGKPIERMVEHRWIDPLINGTVDISYTLNKNDGPVLNSPVTTLQIRSTSARLPAPVVDYAEGETLDPAKVPAGGTTLRVNYTPMLAGEWVTINWAGKVSFSDTFPVSSNWGGKEIPFSLEKRFVNENLNETVQVYYTVARDGNTRTSLSRELFIGAEAAEDIVEDFTEHSGDLIVVNGSIKTRYMTIRFTAGTGAAGFDVGYVLPPEADKDMFSNPVLQVSYQEIGKQTLELELDRDAVSVGFNVHGVAANSTRVRFLDAKKSELDSRLLPAGTNQQVSYTSSGSPIHYIEISSENDWTLWDKFVMKSSVRRMTSPQVAPSPPRTNIMTRLTAEQKKAWSEAFASAKSGRSSINQSEFPKPKVTEAPNDTLNPLLGSPSGVHVEVSYPSMSTSDIIGLSFNGDDTAAQQNGSESTVTFNVPVANVAAAVGKTVQVIYAVKRPNGISLSEFLYLVVSPIPAAQLNAPKITQASGNELDITALTVDADLTVDAWPLIMPGQRLWLQLEGSDDLDLPAWQGFPITSTGTQSTKVPLSYLKGLDNGTPLKLVLEVSFDNGTTRQAFPITTYTIKQEPEVISVAITSVRDSKGEVSNGGSTTDTTVTVAGIVTTA